MTIDREKIAKKLSERGATKPCHRCGEGAFTVLEGFTNINLQDDFSAGMVIGGPSVPVAHVVCKNCGAITPHALGALDMLPKEEASNGK